MRCVLIGNYGVANFGDEALRDAFLAAFPDIHWTVVSAQPVLPPAAKIAELPRLPLGLRSLFRPWWRTIGVIARADAVVFGGGTLFTDIESVLACFLWGAHAVVARCFGVPVLLAAQGVGPFRTQVGEGSGRAVFGRAVVVSVRDDASVARMASWQLSTPIVQTFDPVFLSFCRDKVSVKIKNVFAVIPRHNSNATFDELYKSMLSKHQFDEVRLLSLQPDDVTEQETVARLRMMTSARVTVVPVADQRTLLEEIEAADTILCQRFHGALAALARGKDVRICPMAPGDKLAALETAVQAGNASALVQEWRDEAERGEAALGQALHRLESQRRRPKRL
ncbi:MAG: polysaccharide pyruvyl transferase family protein [Candidatus Peribacteraceae bacterium]|nr:polysaccharide pyruvyl transferase family protein [Candidatus Peribacteraceae bacterium]